jgi:hypothetical protein
MKEQRALWVSEVARCQECRRNLEVGDVYFYDRGALWCDVCEQKRVKS